MGFIREIYEAYQIFFKLIKIYLSLNSSVVEHKTENLCVNGSIPFSNNSPRSVQIFINEGKLICFLNFCSRG